MCGPVSNTGFAKGRLRTGPLTDAGGGDLARDGIRRTDLAYRVDAAWPQPLPNNWKLYVENVKDTYHASLLHTFLATFRISRLTQGGGVLVSPDGGSHSSYTIAIPEGKNATAYKDQQIRSDQDGEFAVWLFHHDAGMERWRGVGDLVQKRPKLAHVVEEQPVALARLRPADHIHLRDTRDAARVLTVVETDAHGVLGCVGRTAYIGKRLRMGKDADNLSREERLAAKLREKAGVGWIDAPVSGGPPASGSGSPNSSASFASCAAIAATIWWCADTSTSCRSPGWRAGS